MNNFFSFSILPQNSLCHFAKRLFGLVSLNIVFLAILAGLLFFFVDLPIFLSVFLVFLLIFNFYLGFCSQQSYQFLKNLFVESDLRQVSELNSLFILYEQEKNEYMKQCELLTAEMLELRAAKQYVENVYYERNAFLSRINHALRTPMNAILGFSQIMLVASNLTSNQREQLGIINQSGEQLLSLIDDIATLAKIDTQRLVLTESDFNATACIKNVLQDLMPMAARKQVHLTAQFVQAMPELIYADEQKFYKIIHYLLSCVIERKPCNQVNLSIQYCTSPTPSAPFQKISVPYLWLQIEQQPLEKHIVQSLSATSAPTKEMPNTLAELQLPLIRRLVEFMGGEVDPVLAKVSHQAMFAPITLFPATISLSIPVKVANTPKASFNSPAFVTTLNTATTHSAELKNALALLPAAWKADLHLAAAQADADKALLLISEIEAEHSALAQILREFVNDFHLDYLAQLTASER